MKRLLTALLCLPLLAIGQNYQVQLYQTVNPLDEMRVRGVPTNCISSSKHIGTNTLVSAPFILVQGFLTMTNFINARTNEYAQWLASTNGSLVNTLRTSNDVFMVTNNIASFTNLLQSNFVFLATVQTNQAAVTTLAISNQTVTLSRLINRIGRMLTEQYKGD